MKKFIYPGIILSLLLLTVLSGCGSSGNSGGTTYTPGQLSTYTIGSGASAISFTMNYAPSGSFTSDDNTVSETNVLPATVKVSNAYWIAQTDVTYQLWYAVYTWATDSTATDSAIHPGHGKYTFANTGAEGSMGTNHTPYRP